MAKLELKNLYDDFRDGETIKAYAKIIAEDAKKLEKPIFCPIISTLFMDLVVLCALCQKRELTTPMF